MIIGIVSIVAAVWGFVILIRAVIEDWQDRRRFPH
jgi:hypothetical protein